MILQVPGGAATRRESPGAARTRNPPARRQLQSGGGGDGRGTDAADLVRRAGVRIGDDPGETLLRGGKQQRREFPVAGREVAHPDQRDPRQPGDERRGPVGAGRAGVRVLEGQVPPRQQRGTQWPPPPLGGPLVMQTLYYADEVRPAEDIPDLPRNVRVLPAERKMAEQLVSSMVMEFDASEFKSEYKHALQKLIKAKLAGKPLAEPEAPRKVIDLQEALKQSLARLRPAAAKARRRATG